MTIKHVEYNKLVYEKLISPGQHSVKMVARRTNIPESTIYKYGEGTLIVPAGFESKFYNATHDIDFLNFIIDDTDKVLINRHRGEGKKTLLEETLDVAGASGKLVARVQEAITKHSEKGEDLSDNEGRAIKKGINKTINELEDLRTLIDQILDNENEK